MENKYCFIFVSVLVQFVECHIIWEPPNQAFDLDLYEDVLDPELCDEQLSYIRTDALLRAQFLDAGIRTPRGILQGNLQDFGNYFQCLGISREIDNSVIEGKYCSISVPLNQEIQLPTLPEWPGGLPEWPGNWPEFPWPEMNPNTTRLTENTLRTVTEYNRKIIAMEMLSGEVNRLPAGGALANASFSLAMCLPKVCTTRQAMNALMFNTTALGLRFSDRYCRLPNDKPWVPGDYVAVVIFSLLGLLTVFSTSYDVRHSVILRKDPKNANKLYQSFSVYTNTRRLLTFPSNPGSLECLDGIRSLAMMWVILGHTFSNLLSTSTANPTDSMAFTSSARGLWITSALITVDTFFTISGILVVYTVAGKFSRSKLMKNLHLFYLNRLMRMFPILAAGVLLQASLWHRISDGPNWLPIEIKTHRCRTFWWSTLLHIQNYLNPRMMCLGHAWYLAIDVQLHILSPLVLYWMLGSRRSGWLAIVTSIAVTMTAATIFNFHWNFPGGAVVPSRLDEQPTYLSHYYVNTLTRAAPFLIGMAYGYLLHVCRGKNIYISKVSVAMLWFCATAIALLVIYATLPPLQNDWDNQTVDNLINSFTRASWALSLGWMIFACVHGYGGILNWFLSLSMWKLPSRLSYAMYIFHYPLIFIVNSTTLAPIYFAVHFCMFSFFAHLCLSFLVGFGVTLLIDSPFSTLIKMAMEAGGRKALPKPALDDALENKKQLENGILNPTFITEHEMRTKI